MLAPQTPPGLLADLARRSFSLCTVAGKIVVTPASRLTREDREAIGKYRDELLAILSPCEPWNTAMALRLMSEADEVVERLGVSGLHPAIANAAAMVASAYATRHLETVRFAVGEFALLVQTLSKPRDAVPEKPHSA